ncbi:hypothetical protein [Streptomyces candidus]|uniref:Uncharacterized protein n=1 Tax=Streptomyces candidus TaxID=67283 RepID=A0A7X0HM30_9ACTN|nr:hypothetical protein [Streptomyces candidus]MBB6440051.1 hypothetical protein [Streptomyces candidus]GHH56226.1 hypothetical protein GCM10018773_61920 [Streptomyces candidus]
MTDLYADGAAEANRTRAHWAVTALKAFGSETGQNYLDGTLDVDGDILGELGGDLLADLLHLARLNGCAPEIIISAGLMHFAAELDEERAEEIEPYLEMAQAGGVELSPDDFKWNEDRPTIEGREPAEWLDHMME